MDNNFEHRIWKRGQKAKEIELTRIAKNKKQVLLNTLADCFDLDDLHRYQNEFTQEITKLLYDKLIEVVDTAIIHPNYLIGR